MCRAFVSSRTNARDVKAANGVDRAASILRGNAYGWFQKIDRGTYEFSPKGKARG